MGSDRITLDINGVISREDLRKVECEANNVVWKNVPIRAYFPNARRITVPGIPQQAGAYRECADGCDLRSGPLRTPALPM